MHGLLECAGEPCQARSALPADSMQKPPLPRNAPAVSNVSDGVG